MFWYDEQPMHGWVAELKECEVQVGELRARQAVLINELDKRDIAGTQGARSLVDWVASTLDMSRRNASDLAYAVRWFKKHRSISHRFADGLMSYDRAVATVRLARSGAGPEVVNDSYRMDLNGVARLSAHHRRVTSIDEKRAFAERFCTAQPTLDESSWRVSGQLSGLAGRIFAKALLDRADEFRQLPGGEQFTRAQRQADALVAMAQDSLGREQDDDISGTAGPTATIFIDLDAANDTGGALGAEVEYGPRVGPDTLDTLLCSGSVQIIGLVDGRPVVTSETAKAIPPAVRRLVAWRDGACTIDACTSRYRLQPHHIRERRHGGGHDPDNLTTLCWFHHHVAIHGNGLRIDPDSPPLRRRLVQTRAGPDPP
ncbi:MAG: hypothetical protein BMS9Abin07_0022 [Acidimicrobiia bacterium]|nr:MAG: hypothetical protein BMS9Abin07_0022 [Acidimicrobiia bacterium]